MPDKPAITPRVYVQRKLELEKIRAPDVHSGVVYNNKTRKQPKCPSTAEWVKNVRCVYIYNGILPSHEKEWDDALCSKRDGPGDCHTE